MLQALRVRVDGDVRPVVQEGKLVAFFLGETEVPVKLIKEYRENAIYLEWTSQSKAMESDGGLVLAVTGWQNPTIRLPLENVSEYGFVRILPRD